MPAVQTTYEANIRPGLEGQVATMFDAGATETRICETVAGIGFGRAVTAGANPKGAVLGGAASTLIGISIRDITLIAQQSQTVDLYQRYSNMGVLVRGDIWVKPVAGVSHDQGATYDTVTGQLNPASGGLAIPGTRYMTSALAGIMAILRLGVIRSYESMNVDIPTIAGTAQDGQTLTASPGTWIGDPVLTYQWLRNGVAIGGATAATRVLAGADVGAVMSVRVTGTNSYGATSAVSAPTATVIA